MFDLFFLLLFLFGIAVFLRLDWIYYVFYVVGGVWLISHWWTRRSLRNLTVSRRMPAKAFAGETIRSDVNFHNRSRLPIPWLRLHENIPIDLKAVEQYNTVISVGGRSLTQRRFALAEWTLPTCRSLWATRVPRRRHDTRWCPHRSSWLLELRWIAPGRKLE